MRIRKIILWSLILAAFGCGGGAGNSGSSSDAGGTAGTFSSGLGPIVADGGAFGNSGAQGGPDKLMCNPSLPEILDLNISVVTGPWRTKGNNAMIYTGVAKGQPNTTQIQFTVTSSLPGVTIANSFNLLFALSKDIPTVWDPNNPALVYMTLSSDNCPAAPGFDTCLETTNLPPLSYGTNLGFFADTDGLWDMTWGGHGNIFENEETQAEICADLDIPGQGVVAVRSNIVTFTIIPEDVP